MLQLFLSIFLFAAPAISTDFDTVYQSALKNSTELVKINASSDEANARLKASNSNFLPKAGVESRYEEFDSDSVKDNGSSANAFVEWNLFNGFKDMQNRKSLKADAKVADLEKQRTEFNFKWITMAKYTKAQVMQESVEVYKKVIDSNLKTMDSIRLRKSSGKISDADYIEFELFDSKLKQNLITLETNATATLAVLENFSGVSNVSRLTTQLQPKPLNLDSLNLKELLDSDKSKLHDSRLKVESAEARKKSATGDFLPEVNLKATHGSLGIRETPDSPESAIGINARWELFSGFESTNNRRVASAQLAKSKAELNNSRVLILSRAEQLKNQLKSLTMRMDFEQKNQKQIERFLNAVQAEYRRGFKNSNDLKSALELVLETQINRAVLRSDYFEARAELQEILGIELKEL